MGLELARLRVCCGSGFAVNVPEFACYSLSVRFQASYLNSELSFHL